MRNKTLTLSGKIVFVIIVIIALFWVMFPFYWAFINSIKKPAETFRPTWVPLVQFAPTLEHWTSELAIPETRHAILNSTMIAVGAATLATILGTLAAYALARFRFNRPDNSFFTTWFLSQRIMPPVLFVIPFFLIMRTVNLLDSVWGLVLLNATFTLPLPVIILSQMFRELPTELEEA
ncbi:MAG: carbohydrate ABC transporter permease, partial [Chloroflexi bacterium]|nr:carbohydrate ABC transporter permease [Chloroflexota bacterium]